MLDRFKNFLKEQGLCSFGDRVLLAVSGGVDSVVMAHLFHEAGVDCAIAHCNFQLRGEDSAADEVFVRSLADSLEMPVYVKHFDVDELAAEKGISIQMAARELRYLWFREIIQLQSFNVVATAHNQNDSVETMLLHLSRGTGIRGLSGIPVRNGEVIRPLLFATRKDILTYQRSGHLAYREDASNQETKYRRNKIRHDVIPILEQINPGFISTMTGNMTRLSESLLIYRQSIDQKREALFSEENETTGIQISALKSLSPLRTWLYELFSVYGFTRSQCEEIEHIMDSEPGRRSISPSHQLYKDRDRLLLVRNMPDSFDRYYLDSPEKTSALPFSMDLQVMKRSELKQIPGEASIACLDYDKIQFPLTIRHWNHGDYFFPLGMEQIKKLSDFFVDQKIPVPEKERTWILASGKKIVWIMGHRIDNRFRITEETSRILLLHLQTDVASQHLEESV